MLIELRYRPQGPTLKQFHLSTASRRILIGPLGSGKTNAAMMEVWRLAMAQEPAADGVRYVRVVAVRNTYPDLKTTTIPDWKELFGDFAPITMGSPPMQHIHVDLDDDTVLDLEVWFLALDRPDDIKKLRSTQFTFGFLHEVKELPKGVIDMLDLRVGRYPSKARGRPTRFGIIGDSNAPDEDHWLYKMAEDECPDDWAFFKQPGGVMKVGGVWVPNPDAENVSNLPAGYYERGMSGKSEDWIKVNLGNQYGAVFDGKPVYSEYVDSLHCPGLINPVPGIDIHIGLDFGLTPAALLGQRLPNGRVIWFDEIATEDMGVIRFADVLKGHLAAQWPGLAVGSFTGDPAGNQRSDTDENTPFDILRANGINALPANTNDFTIRREAVAKALNTLIDGKPALMISSRCKTTRRGMMGGYQFRRVQVAGDAKFQDKPNKDRYSHPCEAGQYLMLGMGAGRSVVSSGRAFQQGQVIVARTDFNVFD